MKKPVILKESYPNRAKAREAMMPLPFNAVQGGSTRAAGYIEIARGYASETKEEIYQMLYGRTLASERGGSVRFCVVASAYEGGTMYSLSCINARTGCPSDPDADRVLIYGSCEGDPIVKLIEDKGLWVKDGYEPFYPHGTYVGFRKKAL
jgi:hypothetical protein